MTTAAEHTRLAMTALANSYTELLAAHPEHYFYSHDPRTLGDLERILRADMLVNEGEGQACALKVQVRMRDHEGIKPHRIFDLEIDRLSGRVCIGARSDRGTEGSWSFHLSHLYLIPQSAHAAVRNLLTEKCLLYTMLLLERDGYLAEAEMLTDVLDGRDGIGNPVFMTQLHERLLGMYRDAPDYDRSPLIHEGKMQAGRWYGVAEIPPIGDLFLTFLKFAPQDPHVVSGAVNWVWRDMSEKCICVRIGLRSASSSLPTFNDRKIGEEIRQGSRGKVFEVPEAMIHELAKFVSPEFGPEHEVTVEMPVWDKPLDTVELCIERLETQRYAYDGALYQQAVLFLVDHRAQLTRDINITVPSMPGNGFATTRDPSWDHVITNTVSHCGCGVHRTIEAAKKRAGFEPDETGRTVIRPGMTVYIIPAGAGRQQAVMDLSIMERDGGIFLRYLADPFSTVFNFSSLFTTKGFDLAKVADALRELQPQKMAPFEHKGRTLFGIASVDVAAKTVTVVPDRDFAIISE